MARHDVYLADGEYLLDVQSDILDGLNTRAVVPLMRPARAPKPARRLNPAFEIDGVRLLMVTQYLSAVPASILGAAAANLGEHHGEITEALDMLFQGF